MCADEPHLEARVPPGIRKISPAQRQSGGSIEHRRLRVARHLRSVLRRLDKQERLFAPARWLRAFAAGLPTGVVAHFEHVVSERRDHSSLFQTARSPKETATADWASSRVAKPTSSPGSTRLGATSLAVARCQASIARIACARTS